MTRVVFGGTFRWHVSPSVSSVQGEAHARRVEETVKALEKAGWFSKTPVGDTETTLSYRSLAHKSHNRDWILLTIKNAKGLLHHFPVFQNMARQLTWEDRREQEAPMDLWIRTLDMAKSLEMGFARIYDEKTEL